MRKLLIGIAFFFLSSVAYPATYSLSVSDAYSNDGSWAPLPSTNLSANDGLVVSASSAYSSTPLLGNLSGPAEAPLVNSAYTLNVIASGNYGNSYLRIELWSDGNFVTSLTLYDELNGDLNQFSHVLSTFEVGQIVDIWAMSVIVVAGNYKYESAVNVDWIELNVVEP